MYDGHNRIFWGILICSFNINLGYINILPNFAGYLLIVSGLNVLYKESSLDMFQKIGTMGMIVALLSFMGGAMNIFTGGLNNYFFVNLLWMMGFIVLELIFFFKVLESSIEYLDQNNYEDIKEIYIEKLRNYTILSLVSAALMVISFTFNLEKYFIMSAFSGLIVEVYLMTIIYGLRNEFKDPEFGEEE